MFLKIKYNIINKLLAERVGFEPTVWSKNYVVEKVPRIE